MTRMAPPRLHRPSLILSCHEDGHEVIVTIHFSLNLSLFQTYNYCENGRSDWPGTDDLVCQPVTLTKGKSLLWLVAPVAGLASPDCTPGQEPVLLSRDLALWVTTCPWPGSHATSSCRGHPCMVPERGRREREGSEAAWTTGHRSRLGILHKGDSFHVEKKVCYLGPGLSCQSLTESGWARRM